MTEVIAGATKIAGEQQVIKAARQLRYKKVKTAF